MRVNGMNLRPVDYVTGAAMAFRRDVLEQMWAIWMKRFWPGYFEDVDFLFSRPRVWI
jgi:hypothetical protein